MLGIDDCPIFPLEYLTFRNASIADPLKKMAILVYRRGAFWLQYSHYDKNVCSIFRGMRYVIVWKGFAR